MANKADQPTALGGNYEYEDLVEKTHRQTHPLKDADWKTINEIARIAKKTVYGMHPDELEVHDFSKEDVYRIERELRELNADSEKEDGWYEVTFTQEQIRFLHSGIVEMMINDDYDYADRHKKISHLLAPSSRE